MKILVAVKRVVDPGVGIRVKADGSGVDTAGAKMSMNPFDEVAMEEAVKLREAGTATEIVAVSIGSAKTEETLRQALAMGADRAMLIETDLAPEPLGVAKLLQAIIAMETPQLVLLGKQAIDDDSSQTGQMLAALLAWDQATAASKIEIAGDKALVTQEVDGGLQSVRLTLPAIVTVDLRLNTPRYASLPNIMRAKKKPLDKRAAVDLGVDVTPRLTVLKTEPPVAREAGVRLQSVAELVDRLSSEAGVI